MSLKYEFSELRTSVQAGLARRKAQSMQQAEYDRADQSVTNLWSYQLTLFLLVMIAGAGLLLPFDGDLSRLAVSVQWLPVEILKSLTNLVLAAPYVALFTVIIAVCLVRRHRLRGQEGYGLKIPELLQSYNRLGTIAGQSLFGISAILSAGLIVNILKYFVGRPRPFLIDSAGPFDFKPFDFSHAYVSFPSGHACTAAVLATLLALWFPRYRFSAYAGLALIASSRVFVQAHYPSDVVTGFAIGTVTTLILARFLAQSGLLFRLGEGQLFPELKNIISRRIKLQGA